LFAGLFYLIIILLVITLSPEGNAIVYEEKPWHALGIALGIYGALLILIYQIARHRTMWIRKHKALGYSLVNVVLITYLLAFHFAFAAHRAIPISFITATFSLALYFGGLAIYHMGSYYRRFLFPGSDNETAFNYTSQHLRMWIPFVIPFLFFTLLYDLLLLLPENSWTTLLLHPEDNPASLFVFFAFTVCILSLIMIFLPYFIQKLWLCEEIDDTDMWLRLVKTCEKAKFRCAGLRIWTVMNNFHTAAIIGIIPRFRYVMFTKRLLYEVPVECIEAILIHEIGHCYRRHLLILPFILFGMFAVPSLISLLFFESMYQTLALMDILSPSIFWGFIFPFTLLVPYVLIMAIYFRLIFGFFSRLFERQADLHSYVVGTPPEHMINALDQIGIATGNTHNHPSWHHYSIRERIDFLEHAIKHPDCIEKHHSRVRRWVSFYFLVFFGACAILFSSSLTRYSPFDTIHETINGASTEIKGWTTRNLTNRTADHLIEIYQLPGDPHLIRKAIVNGLNQYIGYYDDGLVEYAAAEELYGEDELAASLKLMSQFWSKISVTNLTDTGLNESEIFTRTLLESSSKDPQLENYRNELMKSYTHNGEEP
jgi:Zn-dependent protease with chaperone function